ncbi:TIM barrel protein [Leucobacter alluvii]|uniref:TIM barrel protein n=1 Tax=Leucobacter alluvii TaxID=340321 RepID=A0ABN3B5E7_9MICO
MPSLSRQNLTGSNFAYQHISFTHFLDDMVDLDLRELELWGIAPHLHIPQLTRGDIEQIERQLSERELSVRCITPEQVMYPVNIASSDPVLRANSLAFFRRAAEIGAELGAQWLFLTPGRGLEDETPQSAWGRSAEALSEIGDYAASLGLGCLLEPLQRVESNLINSVAQLKRMMVEQNNDTFSVVLDVVAMHAAGDTVSDYAMSFPDQIGHVHLIDGDPTGHLAWGDGTLPLAEYVHQLMSIDYRGKVTFELFGDGTYCLDPRPAVEKSIAGFLAALEASSAR